MVARLLLRACGPRHAPEAPDLTRLAYHPVVSGSCYSLAYGVDGACITVSDEDAGRARSLGALVPRDYRGQE